MKIGILADCHGNIAGLRACLHFYEHRGIEQIFFLGDAVGYFPAGGEVIDSLLTLHAGCLLGNHEAMLLGYLDCHGSKNEIYKLEKVKKDLSQSQHKSIAAWLPYMQRGIEGKQLLFVHGSPWNPLNEYIYPDADFQRFSALPFDSIFMGHTHYPCIHHAGRVTVVNVGSCGLPRDQGNLASCALYDTNTGESKIFRIPFDSQKLIQQYGHTIHENVKACLLRRSQLRIIGQLVGGKSCE